MGFGILNQWKDETTTWSAMKGIKDSFPVQLVEFEVQNGITDEPAFTWWACWNMVAH